MAALLLAAIAAIALLVAIMQANPMAYASETLGDTSSGQVCPGWDCSDESCCADAEAVYRELRGQVAVKAESCCADAEAVYRELGPERDV